MISQSFLSRRRRQRQLQRQRLRQRRRIRLQRIQAQQEEQLRQQRVQEQQRQWLAWQRALEREKINEALFALALGKVPGGVEPDDADGETRPRVLVLPNIFETRPPVVRKKSFTFADVLRRYDNEYRHRYEAELTPQQDKLLREMLACYTPLLGSHVWKCDHCDTVVQLPNGCNNRHCSTCGHAKRRRWAEKTCSQILPVKYCHLILTVPHPITQLAMRNPKLLYSLMLSEGAKAVLACGRKLFRVELAMLSVLHTWGQLTNPHLHSHSLLPFGGLRMGKLEWVSLSTEQMTRLLEAVERELPKRLGKALRKAYAQQELQFDDPELEQLQSPAAFESWITGLETMTWITRCPEVWDRREVGDGPEAISKVVEYLANYVNRVALSDARILDIEGEQVLFGYKDYRDGDQQKSVWIEGVELIHNFLKHQLPRGMHHIRHYGWMARRAHNDKLEFLREYFAANPQACPEEPAPMPLEEEEATKPCRFCDGVMHQLASTARRPIIPELMAKPLAAFHHAQAGVRVTLGQRLPEIQAQRPGDPATRALATEIQRQISDLAVLGFL